ncbi:hypothetical protein SASPL_136410 [Salvia splendens]|uniref:Uncharacterized protein n=1 Tax=Salvia splendens TaxID=180675 RepID=A0A8X8WZV5_SALSN|nr:hypothetical protein SASPL_136410 [Salvia splendens]
MMASMQTAAALRLHDNRSTSVGPVQEKGGEAEANGGYFLGGFLVEDRFVYRQTFRTRRYPPHSQSRPRTPPYTSRPSSYFSPDTYGPQPYSCSDWEQPGVLSDYYEPPHARSISSWYSARQNVYRPPRNAFTSGDQFAEQERPLRQPHCARQSPNSGWSSSESHQQPFLHVKNQTCGDLPSQTSGRRVGKIRAPPLLALPRC